MRKIRLATWEKNWKRSEDEKDPFFWNLTRLIQKHLVAQSKEAQSIKRNVVIIGQTELPRMERVWGVTLLSVPIHQSQIFSIWRTVSSVIKSILRLWAKSLSWRDAEKRDDDHSIFPRNNFKQMQTDWRNQELSVVLLNSHPWKNISSTDIWHWSETIQFHVESLVLEKSLKSQPLFSKVTGTFLFICISIAEWIRVWHFYRPQRSCGQGYVFTHVCHSVNQGGLPQCMLEYHTSQEQTPPEQTPPQEQKPHRSRHPAGADTPPQEQRPPRQQTPAYGQCAAGTHPTGMHSCINCFQRT